MIKPSLRGAAGDAANLTCFDEVFRVGWASFFLRSPTIHLSLAVGLKKQSPTYASPLPRDGDVKSIN
jgi:hypothetical protein